jgi:methyltransferase (TIGR00027 family)
MNPVAVTGLLVAALRAEESKREDRLFDDPFANTLAGSEGRDMLARYHASAHFGTVPIIEVRTRWYDEAIARATGEGIRQFVILAAGMDSRAYRIAWPPGARVFEIDQAEVIAAKVQRLGSATPACDRVAIGMDLAGDWPAALAEHGFRRDVPTVWLVEGLLLYLERDAVDSLLRRVDVLAAPGSVTLYDVIGRSLLDSPVIAPTLAMMRALGAPWKFGTDDPAALLPAWSARVVEPAVVGNAWKRWPFPAAPPGMPGVPRSYFVEAKKPRG